MGNLADKVPQLNTGRLVLKVPSCVDAKNMAKDIGFRMCAAPRPDNFGQAVGPGLVATSFPNGNHTRCNRPS
ncbi:MAG: hypothetical protein ACI9UQ_001036, partial [Candidatus Krumholzibacteriia bacterium]